MQNFRALGALPQTPVHSAAGGFAPKSPASSGWGLGPQKPLHYEFLATRLDTTKNCDKSVITVIQFNTILWPPTEYAVKPLPL